MRATVLALALLAQPATASAEWQVQPFLGVTFGGGTSFVDLEHAAGHRHIAVGVSDNASSSLVVKVPARGMTLIVLANGDGLVKSLPLSAGDLTISPVARLFLGTFIR